MRIAVLGTGMVGQALAGALASTGHEVTVGTRNVNTTMARTQPPGTGRASFATWLRAHSGIGIAALADVAATAEVVVNATNGAGAIEALHAAGEHNLAGKVLLDVSNAVATPCSSPATTPQPRPQ